MTSTCPLTIALEQGVKGTLVPLFISYTIWTKCVNMQVQVDGRTVKFLLLRGKFLVPLLINNATNMTANHYKVTELLQMPN